MRLLEWFRFGKRIDELRVDIDRHMHDNNLYRERIDQLIRRCEELGEIEHIAAEMAEALDAAGEVLDHMRIDDSPAAQSLKSQAQLAFVRVILAQCKWEKWREEQP